MPQSPPSDSTSDISEEAHYPDPEEYGADLPHLPPPPMPAIVRLPQPPGLLALNPLFAKFYPTQNHPLTSSPDIKYWNGGELPLDYVSVFSNPGVRKLKVPPHWHYISWGFSDLYGDGRVHNNVNEGGLSGFGFEFTFRLQKVGDGDPPLWPICLMQSLAKYVFRTGKAFNVGDTIYQQSCSLDGGEGIIRHMLLTEDAQFPVTKTPFGTVRFVQIVGVCLEEINSAKQWNVDGVLQIFKRHSITGGAWLVTNIHRDKTIFGIDSSARGEVSEGIKINGLNIWAVGTHCSWNEIKPNDGNVFGLKSVKHSLDDLDLVNSARKSNELQLENDGSSTRSLTNLTANVPKEHLYNVHIHLTLDAAMMLPSILNARIRQGRSFSFQSLDGDCTITFAPSSCTETVASNKHPIDVRGTVLHVFISDSFIDAMESGLTFLKEPFTEPLPKTVNWPEKNFTITVHQDNNSMP